MDIRFGNYKQFVEFFIKAPRNVQKILYKAYPDFAARMTNEYLNTIKKIKGAKPIPNNPNKQMSPKTLEFRVGRDESDIKLLKNPKATSIPNKELDSAFDTLYGKGKQEVPKAKVNTPKVKTSKGAKIGKGGGFLAAAQGLINLNDPNATNLEKARGATMFGSGALGLASANPYALALAGGLALGDALAEPVGSAIGDWIYKPKDVTYVPNYTRLDITHDLKGNPYTPEQQKKIIAYNDAQDAKIAAQYGQAMTPFGATAQQAPASEQVSEQVGGQSTEQPITQSGMGVVPQNVQNSLQGELNSYQDILQPKPIQPVLNPIVEPVNYSNQYLMKANSLSQSLQPQPQGQEQMINNDPYNIGDIRGYADVINNQMAPVPNQPQNIREDVLPEYLQVMEGIRGKQGELNYADILNQYNKAAEADRRQNIANTMLNTFANQGQRPPLYYVSAKGDLNKIDLQQPTQGIQLPTNTSSNADKFLGQLKIQQAQQADALAQQKAYRDILKAQQERQDTIDRANAMGEYFNTDPRMFLDTDISKAAMQYIYNPNIQAQANVMEAIGKAPTQDTLKAAEQYRDIAGKLDEAQIKGQWDAVVANVNNQAMLIKTQFEQNGMNEREAAALATQWKIAQLSQYQQNYRALMEDTAKRDLAVYGRGTQENVANIYANARGGSEKPSLTLGQQVYLESVKSGTPIPQAIKYAQVADPSFGLSQAEQAELNRR